MKIVKQRLQDALQRLCRRRRANTLAAERTARAVIQGVRQRGDTALLAYTRRFDGVALCKKNLQASEREVCDAYAAIPKKALQALKKAKKNIQRFARLQMPVPWTQEVQRGVFAGETVLPLSRVGCYVPGGRYPLPSAVLMTAGVAQAAGVEETVLCTPPTPDGGTPPTVLVAADLCGVKKVFRAGGAQAVAAMAYGTQQVPAVDKIVGPGNAYVTAAKRLVYGAVDIDMLAGPTELAVLADASASAAFIAADLLAQAEHDPQACAVLFTPSPKLAGAVLEEIKKQLRTLRTRRTAARALQRNGRIFLTQSLKEALALLNQLAPEHAEVLTRRRGIAEKVRHAGTVLEGPFSAEALADYAAGPNHTLPTQGAARWRGGLSARDFLKTVAFQRVTRKGLRRLAKTVQCLAALEGLAGHAQSIALRLEATK